MLHLFLFPGRLTTRLLDRLFPPHTQKGPEGVVSVHFVTEHQPIVRGDKKNDF